MFGKLLGRFLGLNFPVKSLLELPSLWFSLRFEGVHLEFTLCVISKKGYIFGFLSGFES